MNLMKKLLTALRGGAREVGEAVIDVNSMRIYEQEIVDAKSHINEAKESLTSVMAQEMRAKRDIANLEKTIETNEGYALEAMNKDKQELALEVADKIARLEDELTEHQQRQAQLAHQVDGLKAKVRDGEKTIAEHERQLAMVKTTDSVQKATVAISENISENQSQLNSAKGSLERIRKRQQETSDRLAARKALASEEGDGDLNSKLKDAGIVSENTGASVLERLKNRT